MSMRRPGRLDMVGEISERARMDVDGSKGAKYAQQPVEQQSRDSSQSLFVIQTNTGQSARGGAAEKGRGKGGRAGSNCRDRERQPTPLSRASPPACLLLLSLVPAQPLVQLSLSGCLFNRHALWQPVFRFVKLVPRGWLRFGCSASDVPDGWGRVCEDALARARWAGPQLPNRDQPRHFVSGCSCAFAHVPKRAMHYCSTVVASRKEKVEKLRLRAKAR